MKPNKKYPRQDDETGEWWFDGRWYDRYPFKETENYNEAYDRYMEDKADGERDEAMIRKLKQM